MYITTNGTMNNLNSAPDFYFHDAETAVSFIKSLVKSGRHMFIDVKLVEDVKIVSYMVQELQDAVSPDKICDFRFCISI